MVYLRTMLSELRRRRGRTALTALGLAVGVGLVVTVSALASGLDRAQRSVLEPLTGVGTDMTVTRPIAPPNDDGQGGFAGLSEEERRQLQAENGGPRRIDFSDLEPGSTFTNTSLTSAQLSMAASELRALAGIDGVASVVGGLALSLTTVTGTVPEQPEAGGAPGQAPGDAVRIDPGGIDFSSVTVTGVDQTSPSIGPLTSGQVASGSYFTPGSAPETIVSEAYAATEGLELGDTVTVKGKAFTVVGIATTPVGGQSSDVYVKLGQLQGLSGRVGRVNTIYVRAASADDVGAVSAAISDRVDGASVATAETLAESISGSLVSANDLVGKLGIALQLVALLGAILIASLLTLSSVTKRTRELGTLRAIGWSRRLVVRQITGESLLQSVLGGIVGVGLGLAGALAVTALAPTLEATFGSTADAAGPIGRGPAVFFGQGAVEPASTAVELTAQVSPALVAGAVGLAVVGGLVAGAVGALRASRLRPAVALRHID